ncbi:4-hydroxy-tetrahydrodipicolinate synthase [Bacteroidales bacterium OttesenSCG-928-B11]|nr:4-hydroxy-tetrahydrodipicolinate synthase [Bacteroidales bacterium OttesenSCG-928-E04]MDL2312291.1 4-hydroxy-tetrahydrodipicolinate synthase [Bacteroidales bacterium OttesenSCG-928-B11]MDL2326376.1 4-hydroxy-tetrahydrodipicolinate synthase [Bacteroidales bacterium OttesenSCG-928-A14]
MNTRFRGLGVAVVTPFKYDKSVDHENLAGLVESLIAGGVDYLVALGTTSETPTLNESEKEAVLRTIIRANAGRLPVVMGLGGPCTNDILEKFDCFDFTGVDAILSVTPYYNKPSQEGLYEHYSEIAYHSPRPIILYNVGHRTACNLEFETTMRLAERYEKIIAIKEASGNMNQIMKLVKHKPEGFLVISGDDALTLPLLSIGIDGLVSVVANAFPRHYSQIVHLAFNGDFAEARRWHDDILDLTQACFKEGNPAGIKAILTMQQKIEYHLRLPLTRISQTLADEYKKLMLNLKCEYHG